MKEEMCGSFDKIKDLAEIIAAMACAYNRDLRSIISDFGFLLIPNPNCYFCRKEFFYIIHVELYKMRKELPFLVDKPTYIP